MVHPPGGAPLEEGAPEGHAPSPESLPEPRQFGDVAEVYDSLMSVVPYRQWVDYVERLWERFGCRPRRVLDLACGTGNVTLELERRGYNAVGVDYSAAMVRVARRKAPGRRFYEQDARNLSLPERFDACVCLFDSLNYILEPEGLTAAFAGVRRHLVADAETEFSPRRSPTLRAGTREHGEEDRKAISPSSPCSSPCLGYPRQRVISVVKTPRTAHRERSEPLLVFDLNAIHALEMGMFDQAGHGGDASVSYLWRSYWDPERRLCRVEMQFQVQQPEGTREFTETHWQRGYTVAEVTRALSDAGLRLLEVFDAFTFRPPRGSSDRLYFVAQGS